jgi:hypothetical protein
VIHCCQLLVSSLPRYMRAYRPLLSCNNSPIVAVARLVVFVDVSIAWQWIFPALGNSALQTTCHIIVTLNNNTVKVAVTTPHKIKSSVSACWVLFNCKVLSAAWSALYCCLCTSLVESNLMLRPTVSRPVCRRIKHPSGTYDQIFIPFRQFRVCSCGALSLTRGRICRLQLLLALASAGIHGSVSRRIRDRILLSQIRDFQIRRLLQLAGLRWSYPTPPPQGGLPVCVFWSVVTSPHSFWEPNRDHPVIPFCYWLS